PLAKSASANRQTAQAPIAKSASANRQARKRQPARGEYSAMRIARASQRRAMSNAFRPSTARLQSLLQNLATSAPRSPLTNLTGRGARGLGCSVIEASVWRRLPSAEAPRLERAHL